MDGAKREIARENGMRGIFLLVLLASVCLAGGCAAEQRSENPHVEKPASVYEGLKGHSAAVMVWADWRARTEYNQIQLDTAKKLTAKLEQRLKKEGKKSESALSPFTNPASVVRYQRENPEVMSKPIEEVAPALKAERVIYVELEEFSAHAPEAIMVLKGHAKATLRVLEVSGGVAKVVFEEAGITANYPHNAPEGVIASDTVNVRTIYDGTLELLWEKVASRFKI